MKKYILAAAALAALTGFCFTQQVPAHKLLKQAPGADDKDAKKIKTITGTISAIDAEKSEITIEDGKGAARVLPAENAKLSVLRIGSNVIVKVTDNKAKSIKIIKRHGPMCP